MSDLSMLINGLKVTAEDVPDYIERVVRRFGAQRTNEERFADWVAPAPRKTRYPTGGWPLSGRDWVPAGSRHKVSRLQVISSSLSRLS